MSRRRCRPRREGRFHRSTGPPTPEKADEGWKQIEDEIQERVSAVRAQREAEREMVRWARRRAT